MKIGILDFGFFDPKKNSSNKTIQYLLDTVPKVEKLGFNRYWIGEHQESFVAWRNPEILIALLCGLCDHIKIGSGGVLLRLYNPIQISQNFKLLESLFPSRVELGIATGTASKEVLNAFDYNSKKLEHRIIFENKVEELILFLNTAFPKEHEYHKIYIPPIQVSPPPVWLFGNSAARLAIRNKTNLCVSLFHSAMEIDEQARLLNDFRMEYEDLNGVKPKCCIAIAGNCSYDLNLLERTQREYKNGPFGGLVRLNISGTPEMWLEQLHVLSDKLQTDEFIFLDVFEEQQLKTESYNLISETFSLFKSSPGYGNLD